MVGQRDVLEPEGAGAQALTGLFQQLRGLLLAADDFPVLADVVLGVQVGQAGGGGGDGCNCCLRDKGQATRVSVGGRQSARGGFVRLGGQRVRRLPT